MAYRVFARNWWKRNSRYPNGLEPDPGARKTTISKVSTEEEAQRLCEEYNSTHKPGILSRKAEYDEIW
jgi:hypothetical protein